VQIEFAFEVAHGRFAAGISATNDQGAALVQAVLDRMQAASPWAARVATLHL
jgi:hypothetical protein